MAVHPPPHLKQLDPKKRPAINRSVLNKSVNVGMSKLPSIFEKDILKTNLGNQSTISNLLEYHHIPSSTYLLMQNLDQEAASKYLDNMILYIQIQSQKREQTMNIEKSAKTLFKDHHRSNSTLNEFINETSQSPLSK